MHMLDDHQYITRYDSEDALGFAAKQPEQLAYNFGISAAHLKQPVTAVVLAGMGGSALAGEILRIWPELPVPFILNKDYHLPVFADEHTLVICASYSGNTEETLSVLDEAEKRGCQIATMAFGGKLLERAQAADYLLARIPHCPQPRAGVFYMYRAAIEILIAAHLVPASVLETLEKLVSPLEDATRQWRASVPQEDNHAKQLADEMVGKTPIIYAGPLMYPAAYKWKIDINESGKNTAWCNALPEFNHNEFIGWSSHPIEKPFAVIDLLSQFEGPRILERFEVTDRLLSGMRPKAIAVEGVGESVIEHLLYLILLGDFASTYLGILNGVNPTPVVLVEKFKKELK